MKYFAWSAEKNERLKAERGVSCEEVVFHVENGHVLDVIDHPNPEKYGPQRAYILDIEGYAYLVPFVESDEVRSLKTIIPNRKMTRKYLYGEETDEET